MTKKMPPPPPPIRRHGRGPNKAQRELREAMEDCVGEALPVYLVRFALEQRTRAEAMLDWVEEEKQKPAVKNLGPDGNPLRVDFALQTVEGQIQEASKQARGGYDLMLAAFREALPYAYPRLKQIEVRRPPVDGASDYKSVLSDQELLAEIEKERKSRDGRK